MISILSVLFNQPDPIITFVVLLLLIPHILIRYLFQYLAKFCVVNELFD